MKVVLLAGGFGTRLSEDTELRPKPMVEIGGKPILWHIMKVYSHGGFHDFIVCLGYRGYMIKEYFANYLLHQSDIMIDLEKHKVEVSKSRTEPWKISLLDTGLTSMTGGRIKRVKEFVGNETFMLTYGDGLARIDLNALLKYHRSHGKLATVTAVQPQGRFGAMEVDHKGGVTQFQEKPKGDSDWINAGFFVLEPGVFDYIEGDMTVWEKEPLEKLTKDGELRAFKHQGFWKPMDTLRDKIELEKMWSTGRAEWKVWDD